MEMSISELLETNHHRPWPLPEGPWVFYQEWHNALFLHWKADPEVIRNHIPRETEPDLFESAGWISLLVFKIKGLRPRLMPAFSPISDFDEINVRTYVKYHGKPGIYFFSLEAGKALSSILGKIYSELPYSYSDIESTNSSYISRNKGSGAVMEVEFEVGSRIVNKSELDKWLTERYAFFQDAGKGIINQLEIHHFEWPLNHVELTRCNVDYAIFRSLFQGNPDLAHHSPGVQVLTWGKQKHDHNIG